MQKQSADAPTTLEGKKMGQSIISKRVVKILASVFGGGVLLFFAMGLWRLIPSCGASFERSRQAEVQDAVEECVEACVARNGKPSFDPIAKYVSEVNCLCEMF